MAKTLSGRVLHVEIEAAALKNPSASSRAALKDRLDTTFNNRTEAARIKPDEPHATMSIPPLKKGGRGDLLSPSLSARIDEPPDLLDYRIRLQQHLPIVESKNFQAHTPLTIEPKLRESSPTNLMPR